MGVVVRVYSPFDSEITLFDLTLILNFVADIAEELQNSQTHVDSVWIEVGVSLFAVVVVEMGENVGYLEGSFIGVRVFIADWGQTSR